MASPAAEKLAARHNDEVAAKAAAAVPGQKSNHALGSYVDRLVNLKEEQQRLAEDVRELKAEMKDHELNPKAVEIAARRKMEDAEATAKREALEADVDSYLNALGMLL